MQRSQVCPTCGAKKILRRQTGGGGACYRAAITAVIDGTGADFAEMWKKVSPRDKGELYKSINGELTLNLNNEMNAVYRATSGTMNRDLITSAKVNFTNNVLTLRSRSDLDNVYRLMERYRRPGIHIPALQIRIKVGPFALCQK